MGGGMIDPSIMTQSFSVSHCMGCLVYCRAVRIARCDSLIPIRQDHA